MKVSMTRWSPFLFCMILAIGLASPLVAQTPALDAFEYPLFDGKTLNGWTIENDCEAGVQDGMILLKAGNGWLRSDHKYADFALHVEWKALQKDNYDAGIYIRTLPGGKPFPKRGYQANLLQGKEGNIGNLRSASSSGLIKPAGQWNSFDITVVGQTVATTINGRPAYRASGLTIPHGHIGLQVEVPKGGQFLIRNVRVTEFGYRAIFNGFDLTGWEGAGRPAETCWQVVAGTSGRSRSKFWTVATRRYRTLGALPLSPSDVRHDGVVQCTGKRGPWLRTKAQFGDFNFRFEYLASPGGNSGIYVRVPANGSHHRDNDKRPPAGFEVQILDDSAKKYSKLKDYQYCGSVYAVAPATKHVGKPAGQWNTLEINCKGHHITTIHNGVVIVDATPQKFPKLKLRQLKGYLGLQNHSTVVKYRRLRIGPARDPSKPET